MHLGVEVTESSTNKQHHHSYCSQPSLASLQSAGVSRGAGLPLVIPRRLILLEVQGGHSPRRLILQEVQGFHCLSTLPDIDFKVIENLNFEFVTCGAWSHKEGAKPSFSKWRAGTGNLCCEAGRSLSTGLVHQTLRTVCIVLKRIQPHARVGCMARRVRRTPLMCPRMARVHVCAQGYNKIQQTASTSQQPQNHGVAAAGVAPGVIEIEEDEGQPHASISAATAATPAPTTPAYPQVWRTRPCAPCASC